jgi:hypothetical protein
LESLTHTVPTIGAPAAALPLIVSGVELAAELETLELDETLELELELLLALELTTLDAWLENARRNTRCLT